jgi:hypothetical protein
MFVNIMDTTQISDLPETGQQSSLPLVNTPYPPNQNITATITSTPPYPETNSQQQQQQQQQQHQQVILDQSSINQIVSGLQQASMTGATRLRSRDIPTDTMPTVMDPSIQQNYIPQPAMTNNNYINEEETYGSILEKNIEQTKYNQAFNTYFDELQMPLIVTILFFLFQLPVVKSFLQNQFSFLFYSDGNMNLNGYVIVSVLFGSIYFVLCRILN